MLGIALLYNFGKKASLLPKLYLSPVDTTGRFFFQKDLLVSENYFCIRKLEKVYQVYTKPNFMM
jgi:hypothetical protein